MTHTPTRRLYTPYMKYEAIEGRLGNVERTTVFRRTLRSRVRLDSVGVTVSQTTGLELLSGVGSHFFEKSEVPSMQHVLSLGTSLT